MGVADTSVGHTRNLLMEVGLGFNLHVDVGSSISLLVDEGLTGDLLVNVGLRLRLSIVGLSLYLGINVGLEFGLSRNASRGTHSECKKGDLNV